MTTSQLNNLLLVLCALLVGVVIYLLMRRPVAKPAAGPLAQSPVAGLKLQAYERLVLLAGRIAIPSLTVRLNAEYLTANALQMQQLLINTIKEEFDYNISQQIYVSPAAWEAIVQLRDQNRYLISNAGKGFDQSHTGSEFNMFLLTKYLTAANTPLHTIAADIISEEAKKIIQ